MITNINLGPVLGMSDVINYLDYTTGILTQHIPKLNFCKQMDLGQKVIIKDEISKIRDPSSGVTTYLGLEDLPWTNGYKLHHFTIRFNESAGIEGLQHIYYCPKTMNLKFMFIENQSP